MGREEENEAQPESITVLLVSPWGGGQASEGEEEQGEAVKKQWEAGSIPVSPDLLSQPDLVSF